MKTDRSGGMWLRLALPMAAFVVAGSLGLIWFLQTTFQHRSTIEFQQLARANAEFIRGIHIPATDRFAEYLSRVLGLQVIFRPTGSPLPALGPRQELATSPIDVGLELGLVRTTPSLGGLLLRPQSLVVLGVFWGLSLGLGWVLTQGIVRPYLETQRRLAVAERFAMLGKMASALAHEIQNPVAAIRLHTQLLESAPAAELSATAAVTVPTLLSEAGRIESLVNQWMFLAKPEPPQTSAVDLAATLAETRRALQPLADHARVAFDVTVAPGLLVRADRRRLLQAFGNLATNAIQAMPSGGRLRVIAERNGSVARVTFVDGGRGFSATALARCPELFYSEREGGMGIGLSVVAEITRALGGRLSLANPPTGGARVCIELPLAEPAA